MTTPLLLFNNGLGFSKSIKSNSIVAPKIVSEISMIPTGGSKTVIPFTRAGNLILIEASVDGVKGDFILDTGAPSLVLNKTYFRTGKIADGTTSASITGESGTVYKRRVDSLMIGSYKYKALNADLVNLGHLEDSKSVRILGLLGANLFSGLEMEIDWSRNVFYLYKLDKDGKRMNAKIDSSAAKPDLKIPIVIVNNIAFVSTTAGGKKLQFCLDTGAETNVVSNTVPQKVLDLFTLKKMESLAGAGSQKMNVLTGELSSIQIGSSNFTNVPVVIAGLSSLQTVYNTTVDGILGYYFISKGRVTINFKTKELTMYFYKQ